MKNNFKIAFFILFFIFCNLFFVQKSCLADGNFALNDIVFEQVKNEVDSLKSEEGLLLPVKKNIEIGVNNDEKEQITFGHIDVQYFKKNLQINFLFIQENFKFASNVFGLARYENDIFARAP